MSKNEEQAAVDFAIDWWKNRHAHGYFPTMEQHLNWKLYDEMRPWFLEMAKPTAQDVALEIGAGYGQWMAPLSRIVEHVDGFDIHSSLVDKAREKLANFPNARMRLGDGVTVPFQPGYSLVYSISVFQHMPRAIVRRYLEEIPRVMKYTGRALLHWRLADGDGPYSADIVANHTGDWSVGWTLEEAERELRNVGLHVTDSQEGGNSLIVRAEFGQ